MTYKTIDISEDVYKKLKGKKKDNETISDVIERILDIRVEPKKDIRKAFGLWKDLPKEILEIMKSAHKEMREEVNRRFIEEATYIPKSMFGIDKDKLKKFNNDDRLEFRKY